MKKTFIFTLLLSAALAASAITTFAQTNAPAAPPATAPSPAATPAPTNSATATTPPVNIESFYTTAIEYVTSINTNLHTFDSNRGTVWTGAAFVQNVNVASAFGLEYAFKTNSALFAQSITLNAGVAGTIVSEEAGIGYSLVKRNDVNLAVTAGGGYGTQPQAPMGKGMFGAVGLQVEKGFGANTFGIIRLEEALTGGKLGAPLIYAGAGFTF